MVTEIKILREVIPTDIEFSIVLPVFNEKESLHEVCKYLKKSLDQRNETSIEVIFVDDGSTDSSIRVIENYQWKNCKVFRHLTNLGHQQALLTGLAMAEGKFIGMMDSDGQHPASEIFNMYDKAVSEGWDLVQGLRVSRSTDGLFKRISARFFYSMMRFISTIDFTTDASDFRVLSNRAKSLVLASEKPVPFRFSLGKLNLKRTLYAFEVFPRFAGKSKYSIQKMNSLAINSFTSFSDKPLRFIASLGITASLMSVILIFLISILALIGMTIPGWASLAVLVSTFGALNLLSAGIIALYLSMTLDQNSNQSKNVELVRVFKS